MRIPALAHVRDKAWDVDNARPAADDAARDISIARANAYVLVAGLGALPFAVVEAAGGNTLPLGAILAIMFAITMLVSMVRRNQHERALALQAPTVLIVGTLFALLDPGLVDFGLATMLLAPVYSAMLASTMVNKLLVAMAGAALALVFSLHLSGIHPSLPAGMSLTWLPGLSYAVGAVVTIATARRLGTNYEVLDRAQLAALRHLVENVQDAVMRYGPEGQVAFVSRTGEALLGCARYQLAGNALTERVHILDRPAYLTALADANISGIARTVEVRMRRDNDKVGAPAEFIWVEMALSPIHEARSNEERYEVVGLLRDITRRKDQERTANDARKAAEEASSAKSRFLATVGHELRTPLNAIVGFSEMMSNGIGGTLTTTQAEYADLIAQSGRHLLDIVNMLMDMSKIEAGKFELQADLFAPDAIVAPCVQMVDRAARDRKVAIVTDIQPNLPQIMGDERANRQILINLLSNAVKFSHEGGTVRLSMKRQGASLAIVVEDEGIGMDAAKIGRIGEPFFQAHEGLSRRYEGTGLGLSIVKGLVELHDGTFSIRSRQGEGTQVSVVLPIAGPAEKVAPTARIHPIKTEQPVETSNPWPERKSVAR